MAKGIKEWVSEYDEYLNFTEYLQIMMPDLHTPAHRDFAICCPIHEERTASFKYNENMGVWTCFGACKTTGGTVQFHHMMLQKEYGQGVTLMDSMRNLQSLFPHILPDITKEDKGNENNSSVANDLETLLWRKNNPKEISVDKEEPIEKFALKLFLTGYQEEL